MRDSVLDVLSELVSVDSVNPALGTGLRDGGGCILVVGPDHSDEPGIHNSFQNV